MPSFLLRIQKWLLLCSVNLEHKPRQCSAMPNHFKSIDGYGLCYQHVYGYKDTYVYVCMCVYVSKYVFRIVLKDIRMYVCVEIALCMFIRWENVG